MPNILNQRINDATSSIIASAIKVHKALGPGLLESTYTDCLVYELRRSGSHVESQQAVPILYDGVSLDCGYRLDMVVNDLVVVELKAIDRFAPIHTAQMLTLPQAYGLSRGPAHQLQRAASEAGNQTHPQPSPRGEVPDGVAHASLSPPTRMFLR